MEENPGILFAEADGAVAVVGAADGAGVTVTGAETVSRVTSLRNAIPAAQQGRITLAAGLAEDASGGRSVLIGTSEPGGYLRPGVTLLPGEFLAAGTGHAEIDILNYANQRGLRLLEVGATRPVCRSCVPTLERAGVLIVTPRGSEP
jgi:filamentous hemagglutinin